MIVVLDGHVALVCHELAIRPVTSLELGEYEHSLVADFKSSSPWHLLEIRSVFVIVRDEIVIEIERKIRFWDLIFHDHSVGDLLDDCAGDLLEVFLILGFVVARVPTVLLAVLAGFNNKNNVGVHF